MKTVKLTPPALMRDAIAKLKAEPDRSVRAAMLCTAELDLAHPAVMGLFESVNIPEAGEWGRKAQERMRRAKPTFTNSRYKHKPVVPVVAGVGEGNLFVDFSGEEPSPPTSSNSQSD